MIFVFIRLNKNIDGINIFIHEYLYTIMLTTHALNDIKSSLEDKITIFKSLVILKIVHIAIITKVSITVIEELKQIRKNFFMG